MGGHFLRTSVKQDMSEGGASVAPCVFVFSVDDDQDVSAWRPAQVSSPANEGFKSLEAVLSQLVVLHAGELHHHGDHLL